MPLAEHHDHGARLRRSTRVSKLAVSSFSLFREIGPLHFEPRGENGELFSFSMPFPSEYTLEGFVGLVKDRAGVSAIELCQIQFERTDAATIERLRAALETHEVALRTVPIDLGDLGTGNPVHRAEDVERIIRWFGIAEALGTEFVRVNTGTPGPGTTSHDHDGVAEALRRLSDEAGARSMRLLIENHGGASSDPGYLIGLQDAVGPDRVGILLDLGNFEPLVTISTSRLMGGQDESEAIDVEPIYRSIEELAGRADLVHAKDFDPRSDGTPMFDLDRALGIVSASGFIGPISIEWEGALGDPWMHVRDMAGAVRRWFPGY
ncbi:sugar phosphate isomerase/epimerase family protein [Amnibacterium flavum]|uniref:Xylose isomerase-like TIM barrel domain-containing protein n=1 Tax=Amnibacterium flavum TaxID=2173173 RepID=A0A2V1HLB4_9MICO|nr:sugar phosphate isomerase/epimerase family protein [Amnibacterium flavum]PVZ93225.1 hypothetical protein DDQ50_16070 [Amnibacterium flavum]